MNVILRSEKGGGDRRYLTQPRGEGTTWYAVAEVPRSLRRAIGKKRLLRSLETIDLRVARVARWNAVADLKSQIAGHRTPGPEDQDPLLLEAMALREEFVRADAARRNDLMYQITDRAEEIDLAAGGTRDDYEPFEDPRAASKRATEFVQLAAAKATPADLYVERWLSASTYSERTKADARTALAQFKEWCTKASQGFFIETTTDRVAADFRDEAFVKAGVHFKTANKKLSALRQYWGWLDRSFGVKSNPWMRKSLPKAKAHRIAQDGPMGAERPFTDDEVRTLLAGPADTDLANVMRIAALSGMRLDEIGQLRVGDCRDNSVSVTRSKSAAGVRTIPIHSALRSKIAQLMGKRDATAYLFPDFQDTGWDGNRTMALSKRFTYYRIKLGVHDKRPGARRSKVNFHSFRRWFATKAEDAGHRENVVADIMGHESEVGITFGLYSNAQLKRLKMACVESVKLPL
ncbi:tyrosine-type recombinase/integrase [Bradyrhizobium sp. 190]|uniref:tyrosine-type recombinase/integrase n=1 Tax=Bradyrhizobium sp. 190 TaxID=2782658 RepID=UPI001FF81456|nr:tyrosine-type recombinase/integrase [Bradyrhizobium sp. 190]MCK1511366.1 tyrosine-type recombinase/integrase [Bradyrhizobium sp. 190]